MSNQIHDRSRQRMLEHDWRKESRSLKRRLAQVPVKRHRTVTCPTNKSRATKQLEIFALRSLELADQVANGRIGFLDAVDAAYSAAEWAGLLEDLGDDIVQFTLSAAFANARPPT
jgi:hypothetical protein